MEPSPPSLKSRLLTGGAWAFGGRMVSVPVTVVNNALLARLLSPNELGVYFLAFSLVSFGSLLGALGMDQVVVRLVAQSIGMNQFGRTRRVVRIIFVLGVLGALGVGAAYLLLGGTLGNYLFYTPALATVTVLVAVWMMLVSVQMLLAETFRGFHDIRLATMFSGLAGGGLAANIFLTTCLVLLWWADVQLTLYSVILLTVGWLAASVLLASAMMRRRVMQLSREEEQATTGVGFAEVWSIAWPSLVTNLTVYALAQGTIDVWIVGAFRAEEEVALYGAATRAVILVPLSMSIVNAVVAPLIAQLYAQGKQQELERILRTAATLAGIPAFFVLTGFILLGGPALGLLFGSYYRDASTILVLLGIGQLVNVWVGASMYTLVMTGHQMTMMKIAVASALITIIVGLLATKYYGALGMATAASIGLIIQSILMWLAVRRKIDIWTHVGLNEAFRWARERKGHN